MARDRYTVVGARGFIGAALVERLRSRGHDVFGVSHDGDVDATPDLGHVIYASGIAAAAAPDPGYAFAVHVEGVRRILGRRPRSLLYLSSTRVYGASSRTDEAAPLAVEPGADDVYRISKIAGEALCLGTPRAEVRVARLSNVIGPSFRSTLFLSDVLRQAARGGPVRVRTTRDSAKDYLLVDDACRYLCAIAAGGRERLYNVAYGANLDNGAIFDALAANGVAIEIAADAGRAIAQPIAVARLQAEFGPPQSAPLAAIPALYQAFREHFRS